MTHITLYDQARYVANFLLTSSPWVVMLSWQLGGNLGGECPEAHAGLQVCTCSSYDLCHLG